jgi:mersacidin/lichenicidin family type 2 lantibiotic
MSASDAIRAWRDPEFRDGLSAAERAGLPAHPAGPVDLTDADLDAAVGGVDTEPRLNSHNAFCVSKPLSTCNCVLWG